MTSVVVGKDVVPRLGLHQLETLRSSLMTAINKSTDPKWEILGSSMLCCGRRKDNSKLPSPVVSIEEGGGSKDVPSSSTTAAVLTKHPSDTNVSLSTHQPLYPPGRIIHIVRQHPKTSERQVFHPIRIILATDETAPCAPPTDSHYKTTDEDKRNHSRRLLNVFGFYFPFDLAAASLRKSLSWALDQSLPTPGQTFWGENGGGGGWNCNKEHSKWKSFTLE